MFNRYQLPRYAIDLETCSAADLKKEGSVNYANHKSTRISLMAIYDLQEDHTWLLTDPGITGIQTPKSHIAKISDIITDIFWGGRETFVAQNVVFEIKMLQNCLIPLLRENNINIQAHKFHEKTAWCTKALAHLAGVSDNNSSLGKISKLFLDDDKIDVPKAVMEKISTALVHENVPYCTFGKYVKRLDYYYYQDKEEYTEHAKYCKKDAELCGRLFQYFAPYSEDSPLGHGFIEYEIENERQTRLANLRGIGADLELAQLVVEAGEDYDEWGNGWCQEAFGGLKMTQAVKLKQFLLEQGVPNKGVGKVSRGEMIGLLSDWSEGKNTTKHTPLPPEEAKMWLHKIKRFSDIKTGAWKKAIKVLERGQGGRIYNELIANGARTRRWTSKGVQLQNMAAPTLKREDIPGEIEKIKLELGGVGGSK